MALNWVRMGWEKYKTAPYGACLGDFMEQFSAFFHQNYVQKPVKNVWNGNILKVTSYIHLAWSKKVEIKAFKCTLSVKKLPDLAPNITFWQIWSIFKAQNCFKSGKKSYKKLQAKAIVHVAFVGVDKMPKMHIKSLSSAKFGLFLPKNWFFINFQFWWTKWL